MAKLLFRLKMGDDHSQIYANARGRGLCGQWSYVCGSIRKFLIYLCCSMCILFWDGLLRSVISGDVKSSGLLCLDKYQGTVDLVIYFHIIEKNNYKN